MLDAVNILNILSHYGYAIIFPIAVLEGPIVSILAGLLVSLGKLNFTLVFLIVIIGDVVGDTMYYSLGRWGEKLVRKHGFHIGITEDRLEQTKKFFEEKHHKAVAISKLTHGIGFVGLIVAGILKIPFPKYIKACFIVTFIQALVLITIGVLFGHAYIQIAKYLNYFAAIISVAVLIIIVFYIINRLKKSKIF